MTHDKLNECARMLYEAQGYNVEKGYDFSRAVHPQERSMYAIAVKTFNFWKRELSSKEKLLKGNKK